MANLSLTNAELYAEIGHLLGIGRIQSAWDTTTSADVNRMIRNGRRAFLLAHNWDFLRDNYTVSTATPFSDGTITAVNGVVTLAGAIWPTDVLNYVIAPAGGGVYSIESRDSDTQITLLDKTVDADALSVYVVYQTNYDLPSGFGGWEGPISIENQDTWELNESRNLPEYVVRSFSNSNQPLSSAPQLYSVVGTTDPETAIATYQLILYPLPDDVYVIKGRYNIHAGDTLDLADSVAVSDPIFSECYKEAVLAAVEISAFGQPRAHAQQFAVLKEQAIRKDRAMAGVRHGRRRDTRAHRDRFYELRNGTVDLSGQGP